jgi:hypothetical protein
MPRALVRSWWLRWGWAAVKGLITSSHSESSMRGIPARTLRGRSTDSWSAGAGGTSLADMPPQRPVSAA